MHSTVDLGKGQDNVMAVIVEPRDYKTHRDTGRVGDLEDRYRRDTAIME